MMDPDSAPSASSQSRKTTSPRAVLETVLNHDLELLDLRTIFTLTSLDRESRQEILDHSALWESLTRRISPSLRLVPNSVTPRGRNGFLWYLRLSKDEKMRVRPAPRPVAFYRRVESPATITFLLEVHTAENYCAFFAACSCDVDSDGTVLARSRGFEHEGTLKSEYCDGFCELEIMGPYGIRAVEALSAAIEESRRRDVHDHLCMLAPVSARVMLSFFVNDGLPPTVLLNEFTSFFSDSQGGDRTVFRTDVHETWYRHADSDTVETYHRLANGEAHLIRGGEFQTGCDLRYGAGSLPFDPVITFVLSPPGYDKKIEEIFHEPCIASDSPDKCSVKFELFFEVDEDWVPAKKVLPALMRLREDHKRQPLF
jgi:hypothetical protein